ncbi:MAG: hypothetical protein MZV63_65055 [Marinilabiliales bacterium]|nr:hypothetical protein [Marinilabiliales bacterium]
MRSTRPTAESCPSWPRGSTSRSIAAIVGRSAGAGGRRARGHRPLRRDPGPRAHRLAPRRAVLRQGPGLLPQEAPPRSRPPRGPPRSLLPRASGHRLSGPGPARLGRPHRALYQMDEPLSYKLLGRTRDDAAGEALDKIAKFLGLGYPGGPVIEKLAKGGDPKTFPFAVPRTKDRSLDFSFSGLKTGAIKIIRENGVTKEGPRLADFLASFEEIVARTLVGQVARGGGPGPAAVAHPLRRRGPQHPPADPVPGLRPDGRDRRLCPFAEALHRQRGHGRRRGPQDASPAAPNRRPTSTSTPTPANSGT